MKFIKSIFTSIFYALVFAVLFLAGLILDWISRPGKE